jgi:hypothetical protein
VEHHGEDYHGEKELVAGELMLGERIGGERGAQDMANGAADGDKNRVEDIAGEGDPCVVHQDKEVGEIIKSRVADKYPWGELKKLVEGLEGVVYDHDDGERHEDAADSHQDEEQGVSRQRAVDFSAFFHGASLQLLHHQLPPSALRYHYEPTFLSSLCTNLFVPTIIMNRTVAIAEA